MSVNTRKTILIGAVSGLGLAAIVALLALLNKDGSQPLHSITNFFASMLILLIAKPQAFPGFLQFVIFFIYWGLIGGIFGWLMSRSYPLGYVLAFVILLSLVIGHWAVQAKLEREIDSALQSFGQGITGRSIP